MYWLHSPVKDMFSYPPLVTVLHELMLGAQPSHILYQQEKPPMKRRTFLSTLVALTLFSVMAFVGNSSEAAAQAANCCTYTIKVALPDFCCPISVRTRWSSGLASVQVPEFGTYVYSVPGLCPPGPTFGWVSFDGGITTYGFGTHTGVAINGCTATVVIGLDASGCLIISIF